MNLSATRIGDTIRHVESTGSTNADLLRLADADPALPDGLVLLADRQTAGKGRQGRTWTSPPGSGLTFSVLLKPDVPPLRASTLPLVVGLAVAQAVMRLVPNCRVGLKWPNDIQIDGRKLCGILCEMRAEGEHVRHIVAGIGINVNLSATDMPPEIAAIATSLSLAGGHAFDRREVLDAILASLGHAYRRWLDEGFAALLPAIGACDVLRGGQVSIDRGGVFSGTADGIAPDGALLVRRDDGTVEPVYSGDAHLMRAQAEVPVAENRPAR